MNISAVAGPPLLLTFLAGCVSRGVTIAPVAMEDAETQSVFEFASGTWDQARGDSTCLGNRHEVSFSADRREMYLTFERPLDPASDERVVRYRVLSSGADVLPPAKYVIRAAMEGETRTTDVGEPVIWDLVMVTPDRYHWHRTDWPTESFTQPVIRCDGDRPVDRWERNEPEPRGVLLLSVGLSKRRVGGFSSARLGDDQSPNSQGG